MVAGRFAAWFGSAARRVGNIPWQNNYVCGLALIVGPSMLPTMNMAGDVVAVDKLSAWWGSIVVGDVVLFRSPENPRKIVAKRVLGLEGDAVTFLVNPGHGDRSSGSCPNVGHHPDLLADGGS